MEEDKSIMAVNRRSWGILGNPSAEKIEEYKNMPVGSFKNMVKDLSRRKKGKVLQEFEVFVTKRESTLTRGVIKVEAFDWNEASLLADMQREQIVWDEQPFKSDQIDYIKQSVDPLKYKTW
jgi:hypothetical protein